MTGLGTPLIALGHRCESGGVHGLGRRPSRADLTPIDVEAIKAWTAANLRARRAYYAQPNACTKAIYRAGYR